jgi:tripartite-type tricarboxylate transporter receptor subunit TctC
MAGELFKYVSQTDIVHVPYSGSSGARNDVMGGHVQMMFDAITTMVGAIRGGQLRALMTSGAKRSTVLPEVPTATEAGLKGFDATIWLGLMAPAKTPQNVVEKLNAAVNEILKRPDIQKTWSEQGADPTPMTIDAFDSYLRKDIDKWSNLVKTANIKVE